MAKDIQDRVGQILESDTARHIVGAAVDEALKGLSKARSSGTRLGRKSQGGVRGAVSGVRNTLPGGSDGGGMSGMRTLAAGAGGLASVIHGKDRPPSGEPVEFDVDRWAEGQPRPHHQWRHGARDGDLAHLPFPPQMPSVAECRRVSLPRS